VHDDLSGNDERLAAALDAMRQPPATSPHAVALVAARAVLANAPAARVTRWGYRAAAALLIVAAGVMMTTRRSTTSPALAQADVPERPARSLAPLSARPVLATGSRPIVFELEAANAQSVQVLGDFNGWSRDADRMQRDADGRWRLTALLPPGRYIYAYLVDGRHFERDPAREAVEDRDFGVTGSELVVSEAP